MGQSGPFVYYLISSRTSPLKQAYSPWLNFLDWMAWWVLAKQLKMLSSVHTSECRILELINNRVTAIQGSTGSLSWMAIRQRGKKGMMDAHIFWKDYVEVFSSKLAPTMGTMTRWSGMPSHILTRFDSPCTEFQVPHPSR
eukprot:1148423-Pelagomonas_calceolata.AAC.2